MPDAEAIAQQQQRLATYRSTLAVYLQRQAMLSTAHIPPEVVHGIVEARASIQSIKATLRSWGVAVEDLPDDSELAENERQINIHPLFTPNNTLFADVTIDVIISHLHEWKSVHTTVQSLLLYTLPVDRAIQRAERQITEESIYFIEYMWSSQCSWRVEKILTTFDDLTFIRDKSMDDLYTTIGSRIIDRIIRKLKTDNKEILVELRNHIGKLLGLLTDVMIITDLNIIRIAESIKVKKTPQ